MLFHTPEFLGLLIVTLLLYYPFPKARVGLLTVANIAFYAVSGLGFLALFLTVLIFTYCCVRLMRGKYRRVFLWLAVGANALNLMFFKYSVFALQSLERILPFPIVTADSFWLKIALPIGISFYTFEMIAYAVDVYKGKIEPVRSLFKFGVFISFFAHMIAGPIMRGGELMPQIERLPRIRFNSDDIKRGILYFTMGLTKKILFADYLAPIVDGFFVDTAGLSGAEGWVASALFAFQIYFDFSAYSDMAVGIGYLFGIKLLINFRTPYLSSNATEFWRRWHITLSTWIRDYIYIPLGGSRKGIGRLYFNLFAAMTLSGVWHGAAWTFVAWGMFYGVLQIAHKLYNDLKQKLGLEWLDGKKLYRIFTIAVFFPVTCIGWVLFRVHDGIHSALSLMYRMLSPEAFLFPTKLHRYISIIAICYLLHLLEYVLIEKNAEVSAWWRRYFPAPVRGLVYTAIIAVLVVFLKSGVSTFIYFQF